VPAAVLMASLPPSGVMAAALRQLRAIRCWSHPSSSMAICCGCLAIRRDAALRSSPATPPTSASIATRNS
jgi:hypothetical protein